MQLDPSGITLVWYHHRCGSKWDNTGVVHPHVCVVGGTACLFIVGCVFFHQPSKPHAITCEHNCCWGGDAAVIHVHTQFVVLSASACVVVSLVGTCWGMLLLYVHIHVHKLT